MGYEVLYDFANEALPIKPMIFMPLLFVFIGVGIIMYHIKQKDMNKMKRTYGIIFGSIAGSFALVVSILVIPSHFIDYYKTKDIYYNKEYKVIEGTLNNFDPMPYTGHKTESFSINQVCFEYSDYDLSYYGFRNTKSHGGPVDEGKRFRISYFNNGKRNIILKIEAPIN